MLTLASNDTVVPPAFARRSHQSAGKTRWVSPCNSPLSHTMNIYAPNNELDGVRLIDTEARQDRLHHMPHSQSKVR